MKASDFHSKVHHSGLHPALAWIFALAFVLAASPLANAQDALDVPDIDELQSDEEEDKQQAPRRLGSEQYKSGRDVLKVFRPVVLKASLSTVRIKADGKTAALGTVVDAEGYIISKASELKGSITCRMRNGSELPAEVVGVDKNNDIALLKINPEGLELTAVEWATQVPPIGSWAVTAGPRVDPVSIGVISVKERRIRSQQVVLGVMLSQNNEEENGARVERVFPNSGAALAGIQPNDKIIKVDGFEVAGQEDLVASLQKFDAGQQVKLTIVRGEKELEVDVFLRTIDTMANSRFNIQNKLAGATSERNYGFESVFQHDTVIRPSDCGSPVVGLDGKVIGINIARAGRVASYALPSQLVIDVVAAIKQNAAQPQTAQDAEPAPAEDEENVTAP